MVLSPTVAYKVQISLIDSFLENDKMGQVEYLHSGELVECGLPSL